MRGLMLYARSRSAPAGLIGVFGIGVALLALTGWLGAQHVGPRTLSFALALGVMAACPGLAGPDPALDRTASFTWPPRRAAHLVALAVAASCVALLVKAVAGPAVAAEVIVRDTVGLAGLAGLGATAFGGSLGWCVPAGALLFTLPFDADSAPMRAVTWLARPAGTTEATAVALVLAAAGLLAYAILGPRRTTT